MAERTSTGPAAGAMPDGRAQPGVVDIHSHLIPGVDDGAQDTEESAAGLQAFRDAGVRAIITTPHVELGLDRLGGMPARLAEIDRGWAALEALAPAVGVEVHRGAELRLDVPTPDLTDPRMRLAGGRFVLVEFPYFVVPPRSPRVVAWLREQGWVPIIAHPERYSGVEEDIGVVREWRDAGGYLQINGGSLLGRYGETARRNALRLLARGWAEYVSSDYHARGVPRVQDYRKRLIEWGGERQAEKLTVTNPGRLLEDALPLAVEPLESKEAAKAERQP